MTEVPWVAIRIFGPGYTLMPTRGYDCTMWVWVSYAPEDIGDSEMVGELTTTHGEYDDNWEWDFEGNTETSEVLLGPVFGTYNDHFNGEVHLAGGFDT